MCIKFLLMLPKILYALFIFWAIWSLNARLLSNITPKSFMEFSFSNIYVVFPSVIWHWVSSCRYVRWWSIGDPAPWQESQTFRTQDLSFRRTKSPYGELSSPGNESSWNFRSKDLSFAGTFVLGEQKFQGTFVPGTFRSQELSFPYLRALVYNSSLGVVIVYDADLNC